jgi:hypothetical protein
MVRPSEHWVLLTGEPGDRLQAPSATTRPCCFPWAGVSSRRLTRVPAKLPEKEERKGREEKGNMEEEVTESRKLSKSGLCRDSCGLLTA